MPTSLSIEHLEFGDVLNVWKNDEGLSHCENGPAELLFDENGRLISEAYCINGNYHRLGGPALISYSYNARGERFVAVEGYFKDGVHYREGGGPVEISYMHGKKSAEIYYLPNPNEEEDIEHSVMYDVRTGVKIRETFSEGLSFQSLEDNPADIMYSEDGFVVEAIWYRDGVYHRDGDKPAHIIYDNGLPVESRWYLNGVMHRDLGPAVVIHREEHWKYGSRTA